MSGVAWICKKEGCYVKVTFTSGWPWVREIAGGDRILNDGCNGTDNGFITLEPTDQVIILQKGGTFTPAGRVLGEVKIGSR